MNCFCSNQLAPIYKGDDATIKMLVMFDDGSKMDFQGKTIKFIIKKSKSEEDNNAIIFKTYTPSEHTDKIEINLTKEDTNVAPGVYWYAVRVISYGYQVTEGEGRVEIKQGVFYGE